MSTFLLEIVTPERLIYSEQADSLVVRGLEGELGILPGHVPFVTPLQIAPVTIKANGKEQRSPLPVDLLKFAKRRSLFWLKVRSWLMRSMLIVQELRKSVQKHVYRAIGINLITDVLSLHCKKP